MPADQSDYHFFCFKEMIGLELYRSRIGCYCNSGRSTCPRLKNKYVDIYLGKTPRGNAWFLLKFILSVFYIYTLSVTMAMHIDETLSTHGKSHIKNTIFPVKAQNLFNNSIMKDLLNIGFFIIMGHVSKAYFSKKGLGKFSPFKYKQLFNKIGKVDLLAYCCSIWVTAINLTLIVISYPAIINPGPPNSPSLSNLSVLYLNARGLFNHKKLKIFSDKMASFQSYIFEHKPSIVVLNETWFTKDIHDNEVFPSNSYKVFRLDRSNKTHPFDENNPKKIEKVGVEF